MASPYLYTYMDAQQWLLDWLGPASTDAISLRKIRNAISNTYRDISNLRLWSYYQMQGGPLITNPSQNTGTISYTDSTRQMTLSGATWPTWITLGYVRISSMDYRVASRDSSTQITLSVNTPIGADQASGTAYIAYRDTYPLPVNLLRMGTVRDAQRALTLQYVEPNEMISSRAIFQVPTIPYRYTLLSDPAYTGVMGIKFYPPPNDAYNYIYMYLRAPRQFTCPQYTTGTVTTVGTAVTGTGTSWTSAMLGTVIRIGTDGVTAVTGLTGANPYTSQRIVTAVVGATSLTIDTALDSDVTGYKYEISDPIDLEAGSMYTAFLRRCEMELGQIFQRQDIARLETQYQMAEQLACEADSRSFDDKPSGRHVWQRVPDYASFTNQFN